MSVAARRRCVRVLAAGRRPAVDVVADEGRGVLQAGDPEVGFAWVDERSHAGERARRDSEDRRVFPLPRRTESLAVGTRRRRNIKNITYMLWTISMQTDVNLGLSCTAQCS